MNISSRYVLPDDSILVPVDTLADGQRRSIEAEPGDFLLSRRTGRGRSKILDARTAKLLEVFREPHSLVDGVISFSRESTEDPERVLESAYETFVQLIRNNFLVEDGSPEAGPTEASLAAGDHWDGFEVVRLVQLLEDNEIYEACAADGFRVALKIGRSEVAEKQAVVLAREAIVLRHLKGVGAPRLVQAGSFRARPYLALQWCEGVSASRVAAQLRSIPGEEGRRRLLELCVRIAAAYAELHRRGVVHGDVHPGNVLVGADGHVTLIDFGLAVCSLFEAESLSLPHRGGVGYFFEPEHARAVLAHSRPMPPATGVGEQHVVAHLLYRLLTGNGYVDFVAEREAALRQIAEAAPLPFSHWGLPDWPEVEALLARALALVPEGRFASLDELAAGLEKCTIAGPPAAIGAPAVQPVAGGANALVTDYLRRFSPDAPLFAAAFPQVPRCSTYYGGGGVAWFLYRLASVRESPELLSWAKVWVEKALADIPAAGEEAFCIPRVMPAEVVGPLSLHHSESGIRLVQALVAQAAGDIPGQREAVLAYARVVAQPWPNLDLALGQAGALVGCTLLWEALPSERASLLPTGNALCDLLGRRLDQFGRIGQDETMRYSGIAHGWAGLLYAMLRWLDLTAMTMPLGLEARLAELADLAEPHGQGWRWPRVLQRSGSRGEPVDYWPSWCNGTGGMIFLWTLAHRMLDVPRYRQLAEGCAQNVLDSGDQVGQICCGRPGGAYGLLNLYKHTAEGRWLDGARSLCDATVRSHPIPAGEAVPAFHYSLFKGALGAALLAAELDAGPEYSCMPLFESEGWPR